MKRANIDIPSTFTLPSYFPPPVSIKQKATLFLWVLAVYMYRYLFDCIADSVQRSYFTNRILPGMRDKMLGGNLQFG